VSRFEEHLSRYAPRLLAEFHDIRARLSDSDVKGSQNERTVREFLTRHVPADFIASCAQILDSKDELSDEVDLAVCNEYQVFRDPEEGLLIAEGVDFVVQVKALLNSVELDRVFNNAASVKKLTRTSAKGDTVYWHSGRSRELRVRIPYLCFCFTSELMEETLLNKLIEKSPSGSAGELPDALFALDRGVTYLNHGNGDVLGLKDREGESMIGWAMYHTGERTLVEFLRYIFTFVPRVTRYQPPIVQYFQQPGTYMTMYRTSWG
jgi:hypothetical protein